MIITLCVQYRRAEKFDSNIYIYFPFVTKKISDIQGDCVGWRFSCWIVKLASPLQVATYFLLGPSKLDMIITTVSGCYSRV